MKIKGRVFTISTTTLPTLGLTQTRQSTLKAMTPVVILHLEQGREGDSPSRGSSVCKGPVVQGSEYVAKGEQTAETGQSGRGRMKPQQPGLC